MVIESHESFDVKVSLTEGEYIVGWGEPRTALFRTLLVLFDEAEGGRNLYGRTWS